MKKHSMAISIPCHWDKKVLSAILKQTSQKTGNQVKEIYGAVSGEVLPHGRSDSLGKGLSRKQAENFRNFVRRKGLFFNYLINTPVDLKNKEKQVLEYLNWVVNGLKADSITLASKELMQFIHVRFPSMPINVSTVGNVKTVEDLLEVAKFHPRKVVLHHDANRNFDELPKLTKRALSLGIMIEVLVTESCLRRCPFRDDHYKTLGLRKDDSLFHFRCNSIKLNNLAELIKGNFIRPEDVKIYRKFGIRNIKISGRSKPAHWLPEVTQAYINESYDGNSIRLLGISMPFISEPWQLVWLDNKSLDGFLNDYPVFRKEEESYCNQWAIRLFHQKSLKINDIGSLYNVHNKKLTCLRKGKLLDKLFEKLKNEQ